MEYIRKNLIEPIRQMQRYFKAAKREIADTNIALIKTASLVCFFLVGILLLVTPHIIDSWSISIGHCLLMLFFLVYLGIGYFIQKRKHVTCEEIHLVTLSFCALLLGLVIYVDTVPYSDSSATLVSMALIVLPVLFIIPIHETVILLTIALIVFFYMNAHFIDADRVGNNIFNVLVGYLFGIVVSWIVISLRANDNSSKQEIVRQSHQDKLTGIYNKSAVEKECFSYLEAYKEEKCVLIVMDVDNFKRVNDNLGHHAGDIMLNLVGESIRHVFRETDICGRIGGDEFMILMKNMDNTKMVEQKMRSLTSLIDQKVFENMGIHISCSYGAAAKETEYISYVPFFNMADKILYHAKRTGKGRGFVLTMQEYEKMMDKKHIMLVVDDVETNREIIRNAFQDEFDIIVATNGKEAIEILGKHNRIINIMILDIMMPVMDGFQVLEWMKSQETPFAFPVIAISADEDAELKSLKSGVADMITKPFNIEVMRQRVENTMMHYSNYMNS